MSMYLLHTAFVIVKTLEISTTDQQLCCNDASRQMYVTFLPEENTDHHQRTWWPLHLFVFLAKQNTAFCTQQNQKQFLTLVNYSFFDLHEPMWLSSKKTVFFFSLRCSIKFPWDLITNARVLILQLKYRSQYAG